MTLITMQSAFTCVCVCVCICVHYLIPMTTQRRYNYPYLTNDKTEIKTDLRPHSQKVITFI